MSQCFLRILGPVNSGTLLQRHRALRWLAPVGVVVVVAIIATGVLVPAAPSRTLPHTSPALLVAGLQGSPDTQFTGTVVSTFALGLPGLPDIGNVGDGSSLTSLLSGSHTMQVWYGGADRQRVALFGSTEETDLFRNGRSMWQWSSASRTAVHIVLPDNEGNVSPSIGGSGASSATTPASIASSALNGLDPDTAVQVGKGHDIADRSTYLLTLRPHDPDTRVSKMTIAVDGATKVPLAVKVFARGLDDPLINVQFTSIRFTQPAERNFSFTPPADARTHSLHIKDSTAQALTVDGRPHAKLPVTRSPKDHVVRQLGKGWSRVVSTQLPAKATRAVRSSDLYRSLRHVSGSWGEGRLLDSDLLSVLITSHGRVLIGAVDPSVLYSYAGAK